MQVLNQWLYVTNTRSDGSLRRNLDMVLTFLLVEFSLACAVVSNISRTTKTIEHKYDRPSVDYWVVLCNDHIVNTLIWTYTIVKSIWQQGTKKKMKVFQSQVVRLQHRNLRIKGGLFHEWLSNSNILKRKWPIEKKIGGDVAYYYLPTRLLLSSFAQNRWNISPSFLHVR